ncbi:MAG: hypothetical protein A2V67_12530 [Deltaproteobacteria bacterium RBG_13_61_14]|nr:MAG: hypothetical protein A2V67_12530 [Deltaproteobacteria bacterium RBG_13_61_14]
MQRFGQAVGRFKQDQTLGPVFELLKLFPPRRFLGRQEADESELFPHDAGHADRGGQGGRPGRRHHPDAGFLSQSDQPHSRIGQAGRAGVGDQGHGFPLLQLGQDDRRAFGLVVLVVALQGLADAEGGEQLPGPAGVFRHDQVRLAQHPLGPAGEVLQVADGRGNNVKGAAHQIWIAQGGEGE